MKIRSELVALSSALAIALVACSSSDSTTSTPTPQDQGATGGGDTSATSAPDVNPYGVPYPTTNIGTAPRQGTTPGNVMQNFKFLGYKDGNIANGLTAISLADYFDPQRKQYKMIHIQAAGLWCIYCKQEAMSVATLAAELEKRQVAWIVSIAEGVTPGTAATSGDVQTWIKAYQDPYTHLVDPSNHNFGAFYNAAALPWNANLDAKTMEIISSDEGAPSDILAEIDSQLAKITD